MGFMFTTGKSVEERNFHDKYNGRHKVILQYLLNIKRIIKNKNLLTHKI